MTEQGKSAARAKEVRLTVFGSRSLADERVEIIIREQVQKHRVTHIVTSAEPCGVCEVARRVTASLGIPLVLHFLNFQYLRGAFEHRSRSVFRDSDRAVFIHDGISKGTANEVKLAEKMGLPFEYYTLAVSEYKASVGFEIGKEWGADIDKQVGELEDMAKGAEL